LGKQGVSEGEAAHLGVGDSSPGSREAEGEGGEDFYIARSGKRADILISLGGEIGQGLSPARWDPHRPTRGFR
jgi:hypothetical protein